MKGFVLAKKVSQVLWHMLVIPELSRQRQADLCKPGQPGLYGEDLSQQTNKQINAQKKGMKRKNICVVLCNLLLSIKKSYRMILWCINMAEIVL